MGDIALADSGDIDFSTGDLRLTSGIEEAKQDVQIRLRTLKGEYFLDPNIGIPYFEQVLVKNPNAPAMYALFERAIKSSPTIAAVTDMVIKFDPVQRKASLSFTATTITGENFVFGDFIL